MFKKIIKKIYFLIVPGSYKYKAEISFWKREIANYIQWYNGRIESHFNTPTPTDSEKIKVRSLEHSAILTWIKLHQEKKYLADLALPTCAFKGMKVLDIGSGPIPSGLVFKQCELYCLDPLFPQYIEAGFPLHYYDRVKFVSSRAESMPFEDNFFDAVISVNAIDHVDDFIKVAQEIHRVLKPDGKLRMHVHYHKATITEPLELNDFLFEKIYAWVPNLKKVKEVDEKYGSKAKEGEKYVLWSNF